MMGTHPTEVLDALSRRQRHLPRLLRRLWNNQHPMEEVVDVCDDLLADIDSAISIAVAGMAAGLPWGEQADEAVELKRLVYADLIAFCQARAGSLAAVLHRSSLRDLADSLDRVRVAQSRAAVHAQPVTPGCMP